MTRIQPKRSPVHHAAHFLKLKSKTTSKRGAWAITGESEEEVSVKREEEDNLRFHLLCFFFLFCSMSFVMCRAPLTCRLGLQLQQMGCMDWASLGLYPAHDITASRNTACPQIVVVMMPGSNDHHNMKNELLVISIMCTILLHTVIFSNMWVWTLLHWLKHLNENKLPFSESILRFSKLQILPLISSPPRANVWPSNAAAYAYGGEVIGVTITSTSF